MCTPPTVIAIRASGVRACWTVTSGSTSPLIETMLWVMTAAGVTCRGAADLGMGVLRSVVLDAPVGAGARGSGEVALSTPQSSAVGRRRICGPASPGA